VQLTLTRNKQERHDILRHRFSKYLTLNNLIVVIGVARFLCSEGEWPQWPSPSGNHEHK